MLALTIDLQNILFEAFEGLLVNRIKAAVAAGTYEIGLETLRAESFAVKAWQTIYTHPGTGAATQLLTIERKRSEEHTSELQSLMRISYAVFCLKKKKQ